MCIVLCNRLSILVVTYGSLGDIYTGLGDGRIIRISKDLSSYSTVVRTGDPPYDNCGE